MLYVVQNSAQASLSFHSAKAASPGKNSCQIIASSSWKYRNGGRRLKSLPLNGIKNPANCAVTTADKDPEVRYPSEQK